MNRWALTRIVQEAEGSPVGVASVPGTILWQVETAPDDVLYSWLLTLERLRLVVRSEMALREIRIQLTEERRQKWSTDKGREVTPEV